MNELKLPRRASPGRLRRTAVTLVAWCVLSGAAYGWSEAGHKIIASIAWRQLSTSQRTQVVTILRGHPRFAPDFLAHLPDDVRDGARGDEDEWILQQASVWPDEIGRLPQAVREEYQRSRWHYVNRPLYLDPAQAGALRPRIHVNLSSRPPLELGEPDMNVVQAIRQARRVLRDTKYSPEERGLMLSWLVHLVGDLHQPMHSTALFSEHLFPKGDRGGNAVRTAQQGDLHALWDRFPGGRLNTFAARARAAEFINMRELREWGAAAADNLDEVHWLDESFAIAQEVAYNEEVTGPLRALERDGHSDDLPRLSLSEDYLRQGGLIARRRVVEAGFRLGAVLRELTVER